MYKSVIELKPNLNKEVFNELIEICNSAFDNRAGKVESVIDEFTLTFNAEKKDYMALHIGLLTLRKNVKFNQGVKSLFYFDEDSSENCDVLEVFAQPTY